MSILRRRTAPKAPTYTVVEQRNRWTRVGDRFLRETIVRCHIDGDLHLWLLPDEDEQ